ncbi:MAG: hypothetical protein IKE69_01785 [Thermoguttaceae bacterium]|nr:hypothetical protein [Thermoguttaceae bacterium]
MKIDIFHTAHTYDIIYADPPWAYLWGTGKNGGKFCPERHYRTLSLDEICAFGPTIKRLRKKEFTDGVRAGFCEYMERLFNGRFNR